MPSAFATAERHGVETDWRRNQRASSSISARVAASRLRCHAARRGERFVSLSDSAGRFRCVTAAATPDTAKPQAKVEGSFGSWTLLCGKEGQEGEAKERCSLVLPLVEKETQKLVFRVIVTYGPQNNLVLRVDGPTGVAPQRGLEFSPDTKKIYRMAFQTCLPMGCKALLLIPDDLKKELQTAVVALSAEARLKSQRAADQRDEAIIQAGTGALVGDQLGCMDCHKFHDNGEESAPDLTGYGSREWLVAFISNPEHERFYGERNDRMPAYGEEKSLTEQEIGLVADWLRGEWYEAPASDSTGQP